MFFMRLRSQAKWVFLLLALVFGIGFVGFGVGTGLNGGSVGDILGGVFGAEGDATPSVSEAQGRVDDHPDDPDAYVDLGRAYQAEQQLPEAAAAYEQAAALRPDDTSVLRSLAGVYQADVTADFGRAASLQNDAVNANPQAFILFDPNATAFQIELSDEAIGTALAEGLTSSSDAAYDEVAVRALPWLDTLQRLGALEPASQTIQVQIAQAAELAQQDDVAIAAYLRALEIDSIGPQAPGLRQSLRRLGFAVPGDAAADAELLAQGQHNAGNQGGAIFEQTGGGDAPAGGATHGGAPSGSIGEQQPIGGIGDGG